MRGTLFLVVGPSGAGKDMLIGAARKALEPGGRYVFPKRFITRPADDASEDHLSIDNATFERMAKSGAFALHWPAHGWRYAVPAEVANDLAAGRHVVVNASRAVAAEALQRFAPAVVVQVTASEAVRAQRLAARGREAVPEIEARLKRAADALPEGAVVVQNDAAPETAIAAFIAVLTG